MTTLSEPEVIGTLPELDPSAVVDVKLEVVEQNPDGSTTVQTPSVAENGPGVYSEASETSGGPNTPPVIAEATSEPVGVPGASDEDAEIRLAVRIALDEMYSIQDRLDDAKVRLDDAADRHKTAKRHVEEVQDELDKGLRDLRNLENASKPNPKKFPLFDKPKEAARQEAKADIDKAFPAPEAIQPLPATDIGEFYRRKRLATPVSDLGLTPKVVEILIADGYPTVFQLAALLEGGGSLRSISQKGVGSITEDRESKILDGIAIRGSEWAREWEASQGPAFEPEVAT
jgi:hypothetical protein